MRWLRGGWKGLRLAMPPLACSLYTINNDILRDDMILRG